MPDERSHGQERVRTAEVVAALCLATDLAIQIAYGKIGVSTRAAAAVFVMEQGLAAWGELPISPTASRS